MKLLEIKNNLVKLSYSQEEEPALSRFVTLSDGNSSYIAQIVNMMADKNNYFAIGKLLFTVDKDGVVDNYNGVLPSLKSVAALISTKDILALLPVESPVFLGNLAQQKISLSVDQAFFENNLLICAEKFNNINDVVTDFVQKLSKSDEKIVVIDVDNNYTENEQFKFKKDFKLPLNSEMIDYLCVNELSEVEAVSKAVIQDIFAEIQEYAKTVPFIPFENFCSVVAEQYNATNIPELALLKHKLKKYVENNVFAQTNSDYKSIEDIINQNKIVYINISAEEDSLQKELISYIYSVLDKLDNYAYLFVKLNNSNSDKKLLKQLLKQDKVFSIPICSHNYKYIPELKQISENLILFAPQIAQHDFTNYNTFLSKLNPNEYVVYGLATYNIPLIVDSSSTEFYENSDEKVQPEAKQDVEEPEDEQVISQNNNEMTAVSEENQIEFDNPTEPEIQLEEELSLESNEDLVEQVAKDVDDVFYNKAQEIPPIDNILENDEVINSEELTEEELDAFGNQQSFEDEISFEAQESNNEFDFEEKSEDLVVTDIEQNDFIDNQQEVAPLDDLQSDEEFQMMLNEDESTNPEESIPVFPAEDQTNSEFSFSQGDEVSHPKYGKGIIEKVIKYGNKTLCSISFENIGRRLLDPSISEITKL